MRISIRNQLAALVLLSSLVCLMVISVATWFTNHSKLTASRALRFATIASLKAEQASSNLALMERSVRSLSSRGRLQSAMQRYNEGNNTVDNWSATVSDLQSALAGQRSQLLTLQTIVFPRDAAGLGNVKGLLKVTAMAAEGTTTLPYDSAGRPVLLGDPGLGYPPDLYPNLTYTSSGTGRVTSFRGQILDADSVLLLGPLQVNSSSSLLSITVPIINNTSYSDIVGYMTVVLDNSLMYALVKSTIGLGHSGEALLIGPNTINNMLTNSSQGSVAQAKRDPELKFIIPPNETNDSGTRHGDSAYGRPQTFNGAKFPLVLKGLTVPSEVPNSAGGSLDTKNEEGIKIGIGYARPDSRFCDWVIAVEYSSQEAFGPISAVQNVILACIFATAFGAVLWTWPIAYWSSAPIRRLRDATKNAVESSDHGSAEHAESSPAVTLRDEGLMSLNKEGTSALVIERPDGTPTTPLDGREAQHVRPASSPLQPAQKERRRRKFKIPQRVKDGRHFIEDELTDLTRTFNEMSDELTMQYSRLEDRVRERTAELELSKKSAEAANESKTLFIANISHELKTPLNGILGMCAVALSEEDPVKIKRSLNIIYKSGDLLHHLLTDLLTFSKYQVGKNLSLDEREFRIRDVSTQLSAIFHSQAVNSGIDFTIGFQGPRDANGATQSFEEGRWGPDGTGKVKDMVLWGDSQRILQVAINLVSNALKFTPRGETVKLWIRCAERVPAEKASQPPSLAPSERHRGRKEPMILPKDDLALRRPASIGSSTSEIPPEPGAPRLVFEFEIEDTGPGIAPHLQSQIFEPFVQGDLRLTKKFGGTGLGLSICSQLSKLMHGSLSLRSDVDQGSTFTLRIPLKLCRTRASSTASSIVEMPSVESPSMIASSPSVRLSRASSVERAPSPSKAADQLDQLDSKPRLVGLSQPYFSTSGKPPMASPGSNPGVEAQKKEEARLRVLVAEDNMTNAEVVTRMLKLEEVFDVTLARDGQEALEKVKAQFKEGKQFDLIFMDVQMPNLDGRESTRLIRDLGYSAPIVALTAFSDEINQKECLDSGMDYFLPKPIKRSMVKQVLKTYCPPIQEGEEPDTSKLAEQNPFSRDAPSNTNTAPDSPKLDPKSTISQ